VSGENVEIVRSIYTRWVNGNYSVADWADAGIEFRHPDGRETVGVQAMAGQWGDFLAAWDEFTSVPNEFLDAGEGRVVVLTRFGGRSKGSGIPITDFPGAALFTLRDGKVVRLFLYTDRMEALEAAGLSE
jgi:ketosteroid isomerase-like protein